MAQCGLWVSKPVKDISVFVHGAAAKTPDITVRYLTNDIAVTIFHEPIFVNLETLQTG